MSEENNRPRREPVTPTMTCADSTRYLSESPRLADVSWHGDGMVLVRKYEYEPSLEGCAHCAVRGLDLWSGRVTANRY